MIAAVIHLSSATVEMGCVSAYPGSHRAGLLPSASGSPDFDNADAYRAFAADYPIERATHHEAEPGDVLFFSCLRVHGSGPNRSAVTRKTVLAQLYSGAAALEASEHTVAGLVLRGWNHHASRSSVDVFPRLNGSHFRTDCTAQRSLASHPLTYARRRAVEPAAAGWGWGISRARSADRVTPPSNGRLIQRTQETIMRLKRAPVRAAIAVAMLSTTGLGNAVTTGAIASAGDEGGTVRLLEFYSQENNVVNLEWLDRMSEIFESENPGWTVQYESTTFDQIDQKSILDHEAGVSHDVVLTSPQLMAKHEAAGDLIDLTAFLEETYSAEQLADLNWSAGWESASFGDVQLGVPTGTHTRGTVVNNEVFEAAGLDPSTPLTTPEELMEAGIAIKESGAAEFGLGAFLGSTRATVEVTYAPLVWAFGGDFWIDDAPAIDSEASVTAVEWLWDAVNEHEIIPPFAAAADADYTSLVQTALIDGAVGMSTGFGSYWIAALEEAGLTENCFPATAECTTESVTPMLSPGGQGFANAWDLSIHAGSEHPEMAWALIEIMMRPENIVEYPDAGLPPWLSIYDSEAYSSEYWQVWREAAENGRGVPQTPFYTELADAIYVAIQDAINADRDEIPAILADAQEAFVAAYMS